MPTRWIDLCNDVLVCPACRQPLVAEPIAIQPEFLLCTGCGRSYPVQDGIPVLLTERAAMARRRE